MTERVLIVTDPDDTLEQAVRIAIVGLTPDQSLIISQALTELDIGSCIVSYKWDNGDTVNWLFDKLYKSDVIFFNAVYSDQTLVGYLAAQYNSYYFGTLRTLKEVNKSEIYSVDQCLNILENAVRKHGKK
jgi:hypothetical protein